MAGDVRRQLLDRKKGQAMLEVLPAVMIFVVVLTSGLSYFRVMRAAVIRQEIVRNAVFASIHNSGSLTTPPNMAEPKSTDISTVGVRASQVGELASPNRVAFISHTDKCFRILPREVILTKEAPIMSAAQGANKSEPTVNILTYAVIHRVHDQSAARNCVTTP